MARMKMRVTRAMRQQAGPKGRQVSTGIRESGYSERVMFPRKLRGAAQKGVSESPNPTRGIRPR